MRKALFVLLLALLLALSVSAFAETAYSLSPAPAEVTPNFNKKLTVLTADNASGHLDLLSDIGISLKDLLADFEARGVVLQAWSSPKVKKHTCLEISVTKDDISAMYADLMQHPEDKESWAAFENYWKNAQEWTDKGYRISSDGKKRAQSNYYLQLEFSATAKKTNGYIALTTYQGYLIRVEQRVYNQAVVRQHEVNVYNVLKTFRRVEAVVPAASADGEGEPDAQGTRSAYSGTAALTITSAPPRETNKNTFAVEGVTEPGAHVIGVLMPISLSHSLKFETDAHEKKGTFKLNVTIPADEETTWLLTLNVFKEDELVAEYVFDVTEYKKTLIPVTLDSAVPEEYAGNELVIAGTTLQGVTVQCIVTSAYNTWEKGSRPNNTGRFTFKIPMANEGEYSIALVFSKKDFNTRRFTYTVSRYITDTVRNEQIRKQALRVGYNAVATRIDQYVGKTLCFSAYVTAIEEVGDEWKITLAGSKAGDQYNQYMVFMAEQEPAFAVDEKHTFYGRCIGPYQTQSEESVESIPSFDLLIWD